MVCRVLKEIIERFPHCAQLRGGQGRTVLQCAVINGNLEAVKYVLTTPQDINAK